MDSNTFLSFVKDLGLPLALLIVAIIYLARKNDTIDKAIVELLLEQKEFLKEIRLSVESAKMIETQEFRHQVDKLLSRLDSLEKTINERLSKYNQNP